MIDYYAPHASLRLARALVLGGQIGCGARLVGRALSARTGLPFLEIDRQIEHEAGRSLAQLAAAPGFRHGGTWARSVLERVALRRPWSVIVLDRAWPAPESRGLLRERVDFVHIERPDAFLRERLEKEVGGEHRWLLGPGPLAGGSVDASDPSDASDARTDSEIAGKLDRARFYAARTPLLGAANMLLDAGDQHEHAIASILLEALVPVAGAASV